MSDYSLQQLIMRMLAILFLAGTTGAIMSLAARWLGDRGPAFDGRSTLNPVPHLDAVGTIAMLLLSFGWLKPMGLDPREMRLRRSGPLIVALAGLASVAVITALFVAFRSFVFASMSNTIALWLQIWISTYIQLATAFVALNIIPVPPLLAGQIAYAWASPEAVRRLETSWIVRLLVAGIIVSGLMSGVLDNVAGSLVRLIGG